MLETIPVVPETKSDRQKEADNELVISYLTLRNLIGLFGMALPFVLALFTTKGEQDKVIEHSISEYYYTSNGDMLVVLLSVIGVFLLTYKGYNEKWERILTIVAAVCGIGVAFFPTAVKIGNSKSIHVVRNEVPKLFDVLQWHFVFAGLFFISLAIISLHYFPKTPDKSLLRTREGKRSSKAKRNMIFKICGWTMIACVVLMILYLSIQPKALDNAPVIFILEFIAVEAFGISWLTKGETLWPDGEHYFKRGMRKLENEFRKEPKAVISTNKSLIQ